jgi:hypothetical protein
VHGLFADELRRSPDDGSENQRAVEAPAFSHGNKRTQQLEFHHGD